MHKYLRTVGFYQCVNKKEENELLHRMEEEYTFCTHYIDVAGEEQVEMDVQLAPDVGVILRGTFDKDRNFHRDFYYPYVLNDERTVDVPSEIDLKMDRDTFTCMCDEPKVGISLIFHMINAMQYNRLNKKFEDMRGCALSALSIHGKVLIPLRKTDKQVQNAKTEKNNRSLLMEAAKRGVENALETLTWQEMNNYAIINKRILYDKEDLYSVLDTLFMPVGVECDEYSILGNILEVKKLQNKWTEEGMYLLKIECNDLKFPVLIHEKDLIGIPEPGRRFKGDIWMQGNVLYNDTVE